MSTATASLLSDPERVAARRAWEQQLGGLGGRAASVYLWGVTAAGSTAMYRDPGQRCREALQELAEQAEQLKAGGVFRPLCVDSGLHGVHFVDKILGAEVYELDGEEGNWQAKYLASAVGSLKRPDLASNPTWTAAREFAAAFVASGVTVPVLMLPTIASALNIGLNLYGQRLLVAMMVDPAAAHHDLEIINAVLLEIHDWYRSHVPFELLHQVCCHQRYQPPGCGQICGCSTQLVSAVQYDAFIAGRDESILARYPNGGMIHLCGSHTQHVGTWREMRALTAVQLNDRAAEDLEIYLTEMPDKVYYVNPCDGMPLERVAELARAHRVVICAEPLR